MWMELVQIKCPCMTVYNRFLKWETLVGAFSFRTSLTCLVIRVRADTRGDYCEGRGRGTGDKGWGGHLESDPTWT